MEREEHEKSGYLLTVPRNSLLLYFNNYSEKSTIPHTNKYLYNFLMPMTKNINLIKVVLFQFLERIISVIKMKSDMTDATRMI